MNDLVTRRGGQVKGLGGANLKAILGRHGIERTLASEGGRTSRGSLDNAKEYAAFLNQLHELSLSNLDEVELFWIQRVKEFFARKPFELHLDEALSTRAAVRNLLDQAREREKESPGATIVGTVLQHLVGAKLELVVGDKVDVHGASVADRPLARSGDFEVRTTVVHVTTSPGDTLLKKCRENLAKGLRPWIVTVPDGMDRVRVFAEENGLLERVDFCDIEQFLSCNFLERGELTPLGRNGLAHDLFAKFNEIIERCENDPGLKVLVG
jgi:hypothetical protein